MILSNELCEFICTLAKPSTSKNAIFDSIIHDILSTPNSEESKPIVNFFQNLAIPIDVSEYRNKQIKNLIKDQLRILSHFDVININDVEDSINLTEKGWLYLYKVQDGQGKLLELLK